VSQIKSSEDDMKKMGKIGGARETLPRHFFDSSNPHQTHLWQSKPIIPALEVGDYHEAKAHPIEQGCTIIKEFRGHEALYFTGPFWNTDRHH
jgi:hypothetical protein